MAATAMSVALLAGSVAHGQVLSIGDDGGVTTYSGPQVFTSQGATPIAPPVSVSAAATPAEVSAAIRDSAQRLDEAIGALLAAARAEADGHAAVSDAVAVATEAVDAARPLDRHPDVTVSAVTSSLLCVPAPALLWPGRTSLALPRYS